MKKPKTSIANLVDVLVVHVKRNHLNGYKVIVAKYCLICIMYQDTGRHSVTVFIYYQVNHHSNEWERISRPETKFDLRP